MSANKISDQIINQLLYPNGFKADDKKLKIIEATIEILASDGVECVTFESLGTKLGTTKANIRYHFNSKDDLIFMAVKFMVLTAQEVTKSLVQQSNTPEMKIQAIVVGAYQHIKNYPTHVRVILMYFYYASIYEKYREFFIESRIAGQERLRFLLSELPKRKGHRANTLELDRLAMEIQNVITGQMQGLVLMRLPWATSLQQTLKIIKALMDQSGVVWSGDFT